MEYKLVPVEATKEMIMAHAQCMSDEQCEFRWNPAYCASCQENCAELYRDMVASAPTVSK